jgi:hypothetical protein
LRPSKTQARYSPFIEHRHETIGHQVVKFAKNIPNCPIILSAAENQYGSVLSSMEKSFRSRLFLCVHQPPSWFRLNWRDFSVFEGVRGIICLGPKQAEFFKNLTKTVILSKLGVKHDFFVPKVQPRLDNIPRLLFVGQWLRDFNILREAMVRIWIVNPKIELDCVIPHYARGNVALQHLAIDPRVRWHAELSADGVRDLYANSTLLFLPLVDAVANCSIGEALSCGLPIVSTRVGDVDYYVTKNTGELCVPGDSKSHAETTLRWLSDPHLLKCAAAECRDVAVNQLCWSKIASELVEQIVP